MCDKKDDHTLMDVTVSLHNGMGESLTLAAKYLKLYHYKINLIWFAVEKEIV